MASLSVKNGGRYLSRALSLIFLLTACLWGQSQSSFSGIVTSFPGAPSGSCVATQLAVRQDTGALYSCVGSSWNSVTASGSVVNALNIKTAVSPAAVGDARKEGQITWTGSAATTITAPNSVWSSADVGKLIFCNDTTAFTNLVAVGTKISAFNSATSVNISAATLGSTSNAQCVWYTQDDTAAFQAANTILTTGGPSGGVINPGNWYPSNPTLSNSWSHVVEYMPCGGYVVSGTIFNINTAQVGLGLLGESEGCVTLFISPAYSPGSHPALIFAQGPIANSIFGNFQIDGVNFSNTAAFNNKFVMSISCFGCTVENLAGYNVQSGGGSNGAVLNIGSSFQVHLTNVFIQNNGYGGCEVNSSSAITWEASLCSNSGAGGNVENLLVFNSNSNPTGLGGRVTFINTTIDECATGPCSQIENSKSIDFIGSTIWSSHDETAISIDGTSSAYFDNDYIGAYNEQNNSTALNVASGGAAYLLNDWMWGVGTGFCFNNSGSIFDLGGNVCNTKSGGGITTGSGAFFGSASITGTVCAAGNLAASAGWGSTAAFSAVSGSSNGCTFTLTNSGTGQGANPTITFTYPAPFWSTPSGGCQAIEIGGNQPLTATSPIFATTSVSATSAVFTYNGTPTVNDTEQVRLNCSNP